MSKNLEELLEQLKNKDVLPEPKQNTNQEEITDDNINEYILKKAGKLVGSGVDAVEALKDIILESGEPSEVSAYSEIFRAVVGALDTLTKINIQNKKAKTAKELKVMDIEAKKQLPAAQTGDTKILVATREDIIKNFLKQGEEVIDAAFEDDDFKELDEPEEDRKREDTKDGPKKS